MCERFFLPKKTEGQRSFQKIYDFSFFLLLLLIPRFDSYIRVLFIHKKYCMKIDANQAAIKID